MLIRAFVSRLCSFRLTWALVSVSLLLGLLACQAATPTPSPRATEPPRVATPTAAPPTATPAPTATPTPRKIEKITFMLDWIEPAGKHALFYMAKEKGYYAEAGLDVEIKGGRGSGVAVQMVGNKSVDFGFATGDAIIRGVQQGMDVKGVATIYPKDPGAIQGCKSIRDVKSPKDLEGLTIGISVGSPTSDSFPGYLDATGVDKSKVKIVTVDDATGKRLQIECKIDGMVGMVTRIPYFRDVPGGAWQLTYANAGFSNLGHTITVNGDTIKKNPDLVKRFVQASLKGMEDVVKNPQQSIDVLAKYAEKIDKPIELDVLKINLELLRTKNTEGKPLGWSSDLDWKGTQDLLKKWSGLKEELDVSRYFINEFIGK